MIFYLKERNNFVPDLQYGSTGVELECFIPDGYEWLQINYGQGEGQVLINGCEWGFYYSNHDSITVVLHEGDISEDEAYEFAKDVCNHIFGSKSADVEIRMTQEAADSKERFFSWLTNKLKFSKIN